MPTIEEWIRLPDIIGPFLIRCGAAALCGAMIGLERELRRKPAGFRTNILICIGAAMYMTAGLLVIDEGNQNGDPTRIAAQVVTGIGFLGAGTILQANGRVTGLTSAATIWVVAAIGIISGAGYPILAFVASCMVVLTLVVLREVENRFLDPASMDDGNSRDG
jgi:putative Mg2+ transporter-C (MgtC) family protein